MSFFMWVVPFQRCFDGSAPNGSAMPIVPPNSQFVNDLRAIATSVMPYFALLHKLCVCLPAISVVLPFPFRFRFPLMLLGCHISRAGDDGGNRCDHGRVYGLGGSDDCFDHDGFRCCCRFRRCFFRRRLFRRDHALHGHVGQFALAEHGAVAGMQFASVALCLHCISLTDICQSLKRFHDNCHPHFQRFAQSIPKYFGQNAESSQPKCPLSKPRHPHHTHL